MSENWKVIINPKAGNCKGVEEWPAIKEQLMKIGLNISFSFTEHMYHAIELTESAIRNGYRKFIAVGGDGTLHEVVNGIFRQKEVPTTAFTIASIPIGTGNDWGRLYNFPRDYSAAAEIIAAGKTKMQDIAKVDVLKDGKPATRYMVNIGGMAFDAYTCYLFSKMKEKGMSGRSLYVKGLLQGFTKYKSRFFKIKIDGEPFFEGKVFSTAFGIGKYSGGGMIQTPEAIPDDGILEVTVIKKIPKAKVLLNLTKLFKGTIFSIPEVIHTKAKTVDIESTPSSYVEVDGEDVGESALHIEMIPVALNVIVP